MKYGLFIVALFLILPFTTLGVNSETNMESPIHGVLCELFVTTNCKYCPEAEKDLRDLQDIENMFYFVTFVMDKNDEANERGNDYGITSVPTSEFDGTKEVVGAGKKDVYKNTINDLRENRKDIKIFVKMEEINSTTINVFVSIYNNESDSNNYHLRAYVVEKVSRYKNNEGKNIPYGFIGYAFNRNININQGWYNDSATFSDENITYNNLIVVASLFKGKNVVQTASTELGIMQISKVSFKDNRLTVQAFISGKSDSVELEYIACKDDVCGLPQTISMSKTGDNKYIATIGPFEEGTTKVTCKVITKDSDYKREAVIDIYVSEKSLSDNGEKEKSGDNGIPAFEAVGLIIAVILILVMKKKRNQVF